MEYAKRGFLTPEDKISLYGLNETIFWTDLDRWDYSNIHDPQPPDYPLYTLMSLRNTFISGAALTVVHFICLALVKIITSEEFRKGGLYVSKIIHVIENLNYGTPLSLFGTQVFTINIVFLISSYINIIYIVYCQRIK